MRHNWLVSLSNCLDSQLACVDEKFCRLKVLLIQFFPVALSVIFLLVYAKCYFASVFQIEGHLFFPQCSYYYIHVSVNSVRNYVSNTAKLCRKVIPPCK